MSAPSPFDAESWVGAHALRPAQVRSLREHRFRETLGTYLALCGRAEQAQLSNDILDSIAKGREVVGRLPRAALTMLFECPISVWFVETCAELIVRQSITGDLADRTKDWRRAIAHLNRAIMGVAAIHRIEAALPCYAGNGAVHLQPIGVSLPATEAFPVIGSGADGQLHLEGRTWDLDDHALAGFCAVSLSSRDRLRVDPLDPLFLEHWVNAVTFPDGVTARAPTREEFADWIDHATEAFDALERIWPGMAEELCGLQSMLIPVISSSPGLSVSLSSDTFWGAILVSNASTNLFNESLVHEHSHNLMYGLLRQYPMLESGGFDGQRHYSPWRPDARPIYGLLHAVYVFSRVCEYYGRLVQSSEASTPAVERLAFLHARVEMGCIILRASNDLTPVGACLIDSIESQAARLREIYAGSDRLKIFNRLKAHLTTWCEAHPDLAPPRAVEDYLSAMCMRS